MATADLAAIAAETSAARQTAGQGAPARPARDRLEELRLQETAAAAQGISLAATLFPVGTKLIQAGVDRARLMRDELAATPRAPEALTALHDRVIAEQRKDVTVPATTLYFDPATGLLKRRNGHSGVPGLPCTRRALQQLCQLLPSHPNGMGQFIGAVPPDMRAWNWDRIIGRPANAGCPVMLRLRRPEPAADYELYAVCSERYTPADPDVIASTLLAACESHPRLRDAACAITYEGTRTTIDLTSGTDVAPRDLRVGDVLHGTARLRSDDAKGGGLDTLKALLRAICVNLTVAESVGTLMSLRHTGDGAALLAKVASRLLEAMDDVESILRPWQVAEQNALPDAEAVLATVRRLTAAEEGARKAAAVIAVPGVPSGALLNWIVESYQLEPLPSQLGLVHAISRAPQVGAWPDPADALDILAAASGKVLQMSGARFNALRNN
jgi:hypothetical protein